MDKSKFISDIEEALEIIQQGLLTSNTRFKELEEWDSLNVLNFIAMMDSEYNIRVSSEDLRLSNTIEDLFELVLNKKKV